jgi:hypothetical protein
MGYRQIDAAEQAAPELNLTPARLGEVTRNRSRSTNAISGETGSGGRSPVDLGQDLLNDAGAGFRFPHVKRAPAIEN